jgi:hydroxypyruvate isomerase
MQSSEQAGAGYAEMDGNRIAEGTGWTRRGVLRGLAVQGMAAGAGVALLRNVAYAQEWQQASAPTAGGALSENPAPSTGRQPRKGSIRQSVSRWCFEEWPLAVLCQHAAALGMQGIDLLEIADYTVPAQYGLRCTMGYAGGGEINQGLNRLEHHDAIVAGLTHGIPLAQKADVPNVITFSGLRDGITDEEGARNTVIGLKRIAPVAEAHGVTVCMELLNSKRDHAHYMADHTAWGSAVVRAVGSPHIKLLYDAYHMQIMEGDLIQTLRDNRDTIAHIHTGGVPGRHELTGPMQEVEWPGMMRALVAMNFPGYVAHEFVPAGNPLDGLAAAVALCDV